MKKIITNVLGVLLLFGANNNISASNNLTDDNPVASSSSGVAPVDVVSRFVIEIDDDEGDNIDPSYLQAQTVNLQNSDNEHSDISIELCSAIDENDIKKAQRLLMKNFDNIPSDIFLLCIIEARSRNLFDAVRSLTNLYISKFINNKEEVIFKHILKDDFCAIDNLITQSNNFSDDSDIDSDVEEVMSLLDDVDDDNQSPQNRKILDLVNKVHFGLGVKVLPFTAMINHTSMFEYFLMNAMLDDFELSLIKVKDIDDIMNYASAHKNIEILKMVMDVISLKQKVAKQ